jgi:hypothetical protein
MPQYCQSRSAQSDCAFVYHTVQRAACELNSPRFASTQDCSVYRLISLITQHKSIIQRLQTAESDLSEEWSGTPTDATSNVAVRCGTVVVESTSTTHPANGTTA